MNKFGKISQIPREKLACNAASWATMTGEEVNAVSKYTTGEVAKLCGVTVRTVQYYDARGILVPSEVSEGGRRLYSQEDVERLRIICFLRDAGISIGSIAQLFAEAEPGRVVGVLIDEQAQALEKEMRACQEKLDRLAYLRRALRQAENFSVESIGDIATIMENRQKIRRLHRTMLLTGLPFSLAECSLIVLGALTGRWWPLGLCLACMVPYGIWVSRYYFRKTAYLCPQCHRIFRPTLKEAFWARHTPTLRKLTCTRCGYNGFCVVIYQEEKQEEESCFESNT